MSLISLVVVLVVVIVLLWGRAIADVGVMNAGEPITTIVYVLLVLIIVLWLARATWRDRSAAPSDDR